MLTGFDLTARCLWRQRRLADAQRAAGTTWHSTVAVRDLLDVVRQAIQLPPRAHLGQAPEREAAHALVMSVVRKTRLDGCDALAVQLRTFGESIALRMRRLGSKASRCLRPKTSSRVVSATSCCFEHLMRDV